MKIRYKIINFIVITMIFACSSPPKAKIIELKGKTFYSIDSVYIVAPSYKIDGNNITVGLELEKNKDISEYYFPSSEQLRVIIKDEKGKTILNTGSNQNFTTAITPVEPQLIGEKSGYNYSLTGITFFENSDEIELILILPIKPNEIMYKTRINKND